MSVTLEFDPSFLSQTKTRAAHDEATGTMQNQVISVCEKETKMCLSWKGNTINTLYISQSHRVMGKWTVHLC